MGGEPSNKPMRPAALPHRRPHAPPPPPPPDKRPHHSDAATEAFYAHSRGQRIYTDTVIVETLQQAYPGLEVTVMPLYQDAGSVDLLAFAAAGFATAVPVVDESPASPLTRRRCIQGLRRQDPAVVADQVLFGKYLYTFDKTEFILYYIEGSNTPGGSYDAEVNHYLVGAPRELADALLLAASANVAELHDQIWVFDGGYWDKSRELYRSIEKASWDDVILDPDMKHAIQDDVLRFFESHERYQKLKVPWKRGIIYYGPPGNGKTVSLKAMMSTLYGLKEPIPALYVRSLASYAGEEYSVQEIFRKARQTAPCLLVFEDLDSLVDDYVRSYFLNEVDGLQNNDGVLMIGSTNHLDRLDPGISKRPSRFDRKYEFPKPNMAQRVTYCEYWRGKLADNDDIEFPKALSRAIAKITDDFSFAYIQEAFVAALLAIAADGGASDGRVGESRGKGEDDDDDDDDGLDGLVLWREMKKQVKILKEEM